MEENQFNFKFLNKVMYVFTFIVVCVTLKYFGILDKIGELLVTLTPLYVGIVICWISKPLANKIRKLGVSKGMAATISLVIIFAIVILALSYIIPVLITELTQFVKDLPTIYNNLTTNINEFVHNRFSIEYSIPTTLGELNILSNVVDFLVNYSLDTVQKVGSFLISAITAVIISFFMVKDVDKTKNSLIVMASKNGKNSNRYKMLVEMDEILNSYIRGLLLDSIIVGLMTTVLCFILKLKYAVIFGILITFLNLIPYIGAVISHCVISLYALTVGGPVLAIIALICSFSIQLIDANILQPNIIAKSINLHPVVVICGLLVFEKMFGIVGMIVAMPVLALAKVYIKYKFGISFESDDETIKLKKKRIRVRKSGE